MGGRGGVRVYAGEYELGGYSWLGGGCNSFIISLAR